MTSFANLKRNSSNMEKLTKAIETLNSNDSNSQDDTYWRPELDKAGNGYAVIRFLPSPPQDGDDGLPWVKMFSHGFQGPGGWYIENSLTTINQKDPVSEYNTTLWNSGIEANKTIARNQKRKLSYVSNIYIVDDPKNPQNNGKVFRYKYGKTIFDKITGAMNPEFADEEAINPFDLWKGANFKIKIRKLDGYQNYDKCEFDEPASLFEDDDKLEKVWQSEHSLKELVDAKNFKSYDALKSRLDKVLGLDGAAPTVKSTVEQAKAQPKPKSVDESLTEEEDDDNLSYFTKLAEED